MKLNNLKPPPSIDKSVEIFANAFSETAIKKIEKNGGKAHII